MYHLFLKINAQIDTMMYSDHYDTSTIKQIPISFAYICSTSLFVLSLLWFTCLGDRAFCLAFSWYSRLSPNPTFPPRSSCNDPPLFCLFLFIHPLLSPTSNSIKLRLEIALISSRSSLETCRRSHSLAAQNSTSRGKNPAIRLSFFVFLFLGVTHLKLDKTLSRSYPALSCSFLFFPSWSSFKRCRSDVHPLASWLSLFSQLPQDSIMPLFSHSWWS